MHLIYELHFAITPDRSLPLTDPKQARYISARELACVFLSRYGPVIWPPEPQPAPHLNSRALQYPRNATIEKDRYQEWEKLHVRPPVKGSAGDLGMSELGQRMTKFICMVYELPLERKAEADWDVVAFVMDDPRVGQRGIATDRAGWSEALRRAVPEESIPGA